MEDQIYISIAREISGLADEQETQQVSKWIQKDKNRLIYNAIKQQMSNAGSDDDSKKEVLNRIKNRINEETLEFDSQSKSTFHFPTWLNVAAVLFLTIGVSWFVFNKNENAEESVVENVWVEKVNPKGQKSSFVLSDGTLVKLNADSKLTFLETFENDKRIVLLEGEAFFDVKKDATRPFIVKSGQISTTALGTSFNVRAYKEENAIQVALVTGKVKVENMNGKTSGDHNLILNPNDMASFNRVSKGLTKGSFDIEMELAWKNQTLYFKDASLNNMVSSLERWYGVGFEVSGIKPIEISFTGKFKDKSLEYVLEVLSQNKQKFDYLIDGKKVRIIKN